MAKREIFIKLQNGNIEKVSDGETTHYEYAGKRLEDLDDFERQEIRDDPVWESTAKALNELVDAVRPIITNMVEVVSSAVAQISATIVAEQKRIAHEKAEAEKKKKAAAKEKPAAKKAKK